MSPTPDTSSFPRWAPGPPVIGPTRAFLADPLGYFVDGYRAHGPVFRTPFAGRTSVVLAGLEGNQAVLDHPTGWTVGEPLKVFREQFSPSYLTQLDGELHRTKRRRMTPGFRMRALVGEVESMAAGAAAVLERAAASPEPVDLRQLCSRLVAVTQTRALLGLDLPADVHDDVAKLEHHLLTGGALGPLRHIWYLAPAYRRRKARLLDLLDRLASERAEECPVPHGDGEPDPEEDAGLVARMVVCDSAVDPAERAQDLLMLLLAGSETTTAVLLWSLLLVGDDPVWAGRLDEELSSFDTARFGRPEDWPRLQATVVETERLRPPFPLLSKQASVDIDVAGTVLPAGTIVLHGLVVPHFLPEVYDEPQAFSPARFESGQLPSPDRLATFGGGPHLCLGMNLARLQDMVLLALVRQRYTLTPASSFDLTPRFRTVVTPASKELPVRVAAR